MIGDQAATVRGTGTDAYIEYSGSYPNKSAYVYATGVNDTDDRLTDKLIALETHLLDTLAVEKGAHIVDTEPAMAAELVWLYFLIAHAGAVLSIPGGTVRIKVSRWRAISSVFKVL